MGLVIYIYTYNWSRAIIAYSFTCISRYYDKYAAIFRVRVHVCACIYEGVLINDFPANHGADDTGGYLYPGTGKW